jgi:hypothetical protein
MDGLADGYRLYFVYLFIAKFVLTYISVVRSSAP